MRFSICAAAVVVFVLVTGAPAEVMYTVTDLGTLGGNYSRASAMNSSGQVVGISQLPNGETHPYIWNDGLMTDIGSPSDVTPAVLGINDSGYVIGATSVLRWMSPWVWNGGARTTLPLLGQSSVPRSINASGHIVGSAAFDWGTFACLWKDGSVMDLGTLPGTPSSIQVAGATSINDQNQVVGYCKVDSDNTHAFFWENGQMSDLGTLASGSWSNALDINAMGEVVGWANTTDNARHPFLWKNGRMEDLGTLNGAFGPEATAFAINDLTEIVGYSGLGDDASAFVWRNGSMADLNDLVPAGSGWKLQFARDINNRGQIVVEGINSEGVAHAFLLTPLPEPSSLLLFGIGALALLRKR